MSSNYSSKYSCTGVCLIVVDGSGSLRGRAGAEGAL